MAALKTALLRAATAAILSSFISPISATAAPFVAKNWATADGGPILQMSTNGQVWACANIACVTQISTTAGGQLITRPAGHTIDVAFTAGAAFVIWTRRALRETRID
jgi:hypothetical protein